MGDLIKTSSATS